MAPLTVVLNAGQRARHDHSSRRFTSLSIESNAPDSIPTNSTPMPLPATVYGVGARFDSTPAITASSSPKKENTLRHFAVDPMAFDRRYHV